MLFLRCFQTASCHIFCLGSVEDTERSRMGSCHECMDAAVRADDDYVSSSCWKRVFNRRNLKEGRHTAVGLTSTFSTLTFNPSLRQISEDKNLLDSVCSGSTFEPIYAWVSSLKIHFLHKIVYYNYFHGLFFFKHHILIISSYFTAP